MLLRTLCSFALLGPILISSVLSTTAYVGKVEEVKLKKREQSGTGDHHESTSYHYTLYPADQQAPASFVSTQAQYEAAAAPQQNNYIVPSSSYTQSQNYGAPQTSYETPQQSYGTVPQIQTHHTNHYTPQQTYGSPQTNYGSPQTNYGSPEPTSGYSNDQGGGYSSGMQSGGYSGGQNGYSGGNSGGYGYGSPGEDEEGNGGGIGSAVAALVGIKAVKAAKAFKAIKGTLVFWPLLLPFLPLIFLPLLIPLALLLLFLPIAVIIWPIQIPAIPPIMPLRSLKQARISLEVARKVLESEECVERVACHLKQLSAKVNADQLVKKVVQSLGEKNGTLQAKMGKGLKERGNCSDLFKCNPIAVFKKAFKSPSSAFFIEKEED